MLYSKMYYLTLLLTLIFTLKTVLTFDDSVNVGTVLFSPTDLRKSHWTKTELGLIRARRHFQELLPPPNFIDTTNEDYIQTLLKYFKDTYSTIKREAECPVSDSLMTTAFSDALGGYLKLWVLPISKLSYYGGTVSQENIVKLYKFHNEIKRFMGTDGKGWRGPDKVLLKSITVNISPPRHKTRSMKNACQELAYYEKTENGLSIPTPHIDWEEDSNTMFVPLHNQSLIPLDSPNYPNALFKYYDAAKNCIDASNSANQGEFDNRFQSWLNNDVVPHLSDENIYLPLGSVLTLVNKSETLSDKIQNVYDTKIKPKTHQQYVLFGVPIDFTSKKTWVIGLILFLEVAWCIPALIYLAFSKKKKKKENNIYTLLDACRNKGKKRSPKKSRNSGIFQGISYKTRNNHYKGLKIENRPRSENLEFEPQFVPSDSRGSAATDTRSYFGSNACSGVSVIHETMPPLLKSSMKKLRSSHTAPVQQAVSMKQSKSNKTCTGKSTCQCRKCTPKQSTTTKSYSTVPTEIDKTISSLKEVSVPLNEAALTISNTTHVKSSSELKRKKLISVHEPVVDPCGELTAECPCHACLNVDVGSEVTVVNQESRVHEVCFDKNIEINMEEEEPEGRKMYQVSKPEKKARNIGLRLESGRPYLEIKIDKPQTEISVGIGGIFDPLKNRRSKIPKRLPKETAAVQMASTLPMRKELTSCSHAHKTKIPQLKKRPMDDMEVKTRRPASKRKDNLNVTL